MTSRTSSSPPRSGLLGETPSRPAFALRFATRLPNASNESGLGLDTTDFHFQALVGKTVRSIRIVGNVGLGILGDPTRGDNQNDVVLYGVSVARAVREGIEVVGEVNGRASTRSGTPPAGTESRSTVRLGGAPHPRHCPHRRRHPSRLDVERSRFRLHRRRHVGVQGIHCAVSSQSAVRGLRSANCELPTANFDLRAEARS